MGKDVASWQIEACRAKYAMMPWEPTDIALIGDRYYCGCGEWGDAVVTPVSRKRTIHAIGMTGGYYDAVSGTVHCKRDKETCIEHAYMKLNMIGVAAKVGKRWVALCAKCGIITRWKHDAYSEKGPDCGHHREDAVNALKYHGTRAFIHHGFEMSTPERPYRIDNSVVSLLRKKRKMHTSNPSGTQALTQEEEHILKQNRILSPGYRDRLAVSRQSNYACPNTGRNASTRYCIYCLKKIPPGGGASIWVLKNGLDESEEVARYQERCELYGRMMNRAGTDVIYKQADMTTSRTSPGDRLDSDKDDPRLELIWLCPIDWRNVRRRMTYDSTTVPFIEDLFRWIDSRRRRKTVYAHWGKRRMNHHHYYRYQRREAAQAAPVRSVTL